MQITWAPSAARHGVSRDEVRAVVMRYRWRVSLQDSSVRVARGKAPTTGRHVEVAFRVLGPGDAGFQGVLWDYSQGSIHVFHAQTY